MANKYTIIINNKTGSSQNYNLFSEKPEITGVVKSNIWTNIYQTAQGTPDGASAEFEMWKSYYAIVGTWKGGEKTGAKVSITLEDATDRNFFVGLASSPDGAGSVPTATFRPEPGNQYQIQPVNTYYIAYGATFQVGQLLDVAKLGKKPL
ncbi:hypothetical protein DER44DRAFT_882572 [Fusarium oxysporum]|nr:hypothetical protein DER44DRAFT_882572 [Fusarium oxysporum]